MQPSVLKLSQEEGLPTPPTCEQILEDELTLIEPVIVGRWRHGTVHRDIYKREDDGSFCAVQFRYQHNAEESDLTDGTATIIQVQPVPKTVTVYEKIAP